MLSLKRNRARRALDLQLKPYKAVQAARPPVGGWLRAIRDAIGMTGRQHADRLGIAPQSMADLEASEAAGTITLNSLGRAAAALNCHVVYAVVPDAPSLGDMVDRQARAIALKDVSRVAQTMRLEDQALAANETQTQLDDYIAEHVRDRDLWS